MKYFPNSLTCLTLICKWGFDGSSNHSRYKQKWTTSEISDESIFVTSLIPLKLINDVTKEIIWKNPRPSSTRFCRPIRLQWLQETTLVSKEEEKYINEQINNLEPFISNNCRVKFSFEFDDDRWQGNFIFYIAKIYFLFIS